MVAVEDEGFEDEGFDEVDVCGVLMQMQFNVVDNEDVRIVLLLLFWS